MFIKKNRTCVFSLYFLLQFILIFDQARALDTVKQKSLCGFKVAIEGMPGAGKTSAILKLASDLEGKCIVLSELQPLPQADWSILPAKQQSRIYHELWVSRMEVITKLSPHTPCFIFDRTHLTNLAFAYATDKFLHGKKYAEKVENKQKYLEEPSYEKGYMEHKKQYIRDLNCKDFDLMIVLDVSVDTGLARRNRINDDIPWMGSEKIWLSFLREFYYEVLPEFYKGKILYIETGNLSEKQVLQKIRLKLEEFLSYERTQTTFKEKDSNLLMAFAHSYNLGTRKSSIVSAYGYPTLYFRKHSIQVVDGKVQWLNNYRLLEIAHELSLGKKIGSIASTK